MLRAPQGRSPSILRVPLLVALALVLAHPVSAARWYEEYERAVQLLDGGGCSQEAIGLLQSALEERGRPDDNARTISLRTLRYVPFYNLARAHLACDNLAEARVYLRRAEEYGVATEAELGPLRREIARREESAGQGGLGADELVQVLERARESLGGARRAGRALVEELERPGAAEVLSRDTTVDQRVRQARADLLQVEQRLNAAEREQAAVAVMEAGLEAARVERELDALRREVAGRRQAALATPTPTRAPVVRATATPAPRPTSTPRPTAAPGLPTPTAAPTVIATPAARPELPPLLREAAAALLAADYETAVELASRVSASDPRVQAAAHLLAAAARHAQWSSTPDAPPELRERALADVRACRRLAPLLRPGERLFPPRFRRFFEEAGD